MVKSQNYLKGFQMNIKELNQLIESNADLDTEDIGEIYDLFLAENPEVFEDAHQATQDSGDELDGVDMLVDAYTNWISDQETDEVLEEAFTNRTMEEMTENFYAALT